VIRVATDVGGTFTDFAAFDDTSNVLTVSKASTTPEIIEGIIQCFDKSKMPVRKADYFVHGSTVAINIVIERKGAKTGLLTTKGFKDILELGRGNIPNAFDLMFATPDPLVPRYLRIEVDERTLSNGRILKPLDSKQAQEAIDELLRDRVEAIAICLLHSYTNPEHELALKEIVERKKNGIFVTASSEIIRQYREFERTSTAVLNAYVGPQVGTYLQRLQDFLGNGRFSGTAVIMQSSGGTMTIDSARKQPVRMMESGPVGGAIAAAYVGKKVGYENVVAFDMGGTTAKVSALERGEISVTDGYFIGGYELGYPLQLPVVDIFEVGAGGGSIAYLDETGALKVGPVSAGAVPGPACYGLGGEQPTVTDADLVLGRLNPAYFLGGEIPLNVLRAREAIEGYVGKPLGLDLRRAAFGIMKIADTNMAHAVRTMTVQRGYDPREFVMVAYGGAGPAHVVSVARELGIQTVVVPPYPGVFSAIGMLLADARDEYVLSYVRAFDKVVPEEIDRLFGEMEAQGVSSMMGTGFFRDQVMLKRALEMRYVGQEFTLIVDLHERIFSEKVMKDLRERFNNLHEVRYGHAFGNSVPEIVSLRLHVIGLYPKPDLGFVIPTQPTPPKKDQELRPVYFEDSGFVDCKIYRRETLSSGTRIQGPAIIEEVSSTTVVYPKDHFRVDPMGNLIISLNIG
jgi:N-methylhydantoinase A